MQEYIVRSNKPRNYQRSILIEGQKVTIVVNGTQGKVITQGLLSEDAMERLERFYNVIHIADETKKITEETTQELQEETHREFEVAMEQVQETEEQEPEQEEPEETSEEPEETSEESEETSEEVEEVLEEEEEEEEEEEVQNEVVEYDTPSAEEITSLYEEHGTWSAVADALEVSTSTLRKYREQNGLL